MYLTIQKITLKFTIIWGVKKFVIFLKMDLDKWVTVLFMSDNLMARLLLFHSVENMVAEVTLHNNIKMSKNCQELSKDIQKLPKITKNCSKLMKNCPKLKGYHSNYIFLTVYSPLWFVLKVSSVEMNGSIRVPDFLSCLNGREIHTRCNWLDEISSALGIRAAQIRFFAKSKKFGWKLY